METKPCPFCGAEPHIEKELNWSGRYSWAIACNNEDCTMETVWNHGFQSRAEVIKAWNTRWQASRKNIQEYGKYEFCRATDNGYGCLDFVDGKCRMKLDQDCTRTAKEFRHWLKDNGYKIVKEAG